MLCCGLLAPVAWKLGNDEVSAIDARRRDPKNRGMATAGKVLGIIGTVFLALAILAVIFSVAADMS